jgi:hypothetical protein
MSPPQFHSKADLPSLSCGSTRGYPGLSTSSWEPFHTRESVPAPKVVVNPTLVKFGGSDPIHLSLKQNSCLQGSSFSPSPRPGLGQAHEFMASFKQVTIDDTSPCISYSPFRDTFTTPNLSAGWNPYYDQSGFATASGEIGNGTSLHITSLDGASLALQWRGTCYHHPSKHHRDLRG